MSNELDQAWIALRAAFLTDTDLTDLLGASDAIYWGTPNSSLPFPCITIDLRGLNPQQANGSFTGVWRPDLQFNLFGLDPYVLTRINTQLVNQFDIPRNRATPILTDDFQITSLRQVNFIEVGESTLTTNNQPLWHSVGEWRLKVSLRTA